MKNLITVASMLIVLFLSSCAKERLTANGHVISETRNPGTFTGVRTSGSNNIHIQYANEYRVVIEGSSNLIPHFESSIVNNTLYLNYENVNVRNNDIEVFVYLPSLRKISLSGSAKIEVNGIFPFIDFFHLDISGSGDLNLLGSMTAQEVDVDISGSGTANFERLSGEEADVTISGSGNTRLTVQNKLKASISGSGKVYYGGNPLIESHISGSGRLIKL